MIANENELSATLEQLRVMMRGLEYLKQNLLPGNPELLAVLAESSLEDFGRLGPRSTNTCGN